MNSPEKYKHMRGLVAFLLASAFAFVTCAAEGVLEYPFVGTYKREAAQGMAIYKDSAFLFNNTGIVRLYNLKTKAFISEFLLDTAAPENHSNCALFGVEFPEGNHAYPALYVSECYGQRRCFVHDVSAAGAKLIQTLQIRGGGTEDKAFDWYVDKEKKFLYAIAISRETSAKDNTRDYLITKLPLPTLAQGDVTFTKKDFIEQFTITFRHLSQGGVIRGDYLYMPVGRQIPADPKKDPKDRAVFLVNLRTKQIEKTIDLNDSVPVEPEDADFHGDKLMMYCGQSGGVWHVKGI